MEEEKRISEEELKKDVAGRQKPEIRKTDEFLQVREELYGELSLLMKKYLPSRTELP